MISWIEEFIMVVVVFVIGTLFVNWVGRRTKSEKVWEAVFLLTGFVVMAIATWIFWPAR